MKCPLVALAWGVGLGLVLYAPIELLRFIGETQTFYGADIKYQLEKGVVGLGIAVAIFGFILLVRRRST